MKYCQGVLMGVGEDFRSLTSNVGIIDLMELIDAKDWDSAEVDKKLKDLEGQLKKDLGLTDELMDEKEKSDKEQLETNAKYDAERDELIAEHTLPDEPEKKEAEDQ